MDFTGLIGAYPKQRPLTEQERNHQLKQKQRLNVEPHYQLSVIKMNSTFLDTVDKWFAWKGLISAVSLSVICIFFYGMIAVGFCFGPIPWQEMTSDEKLEQGIFSLFIVAISLPLICFGIWLLKKDSFAYTHYPIRFNFKAKMVYVFRTDGSVLSVPWGQIFFTLGHLQQWNEWEVRGHVLEPDNVTVRETFALSYIGTLSPKDIAPGSTQFSSEDFVRAHWEFIRRYMEDGPQSISEQVQFCMPVDMKRESLRVSLQRTFANIAGAPLVIYWLLFPFCAVVSVFRMVAVQTSKNPVWPEDVEANCIIDDGDPFAIEGAPNGERVAIFPEAAQAAGVSFCRQVQVGNRNS